MQARAAPANIGSLTLQQLAAALGSVSTSSPSATSQSPSRPGQGPPMTMQHLQGGGGVTSWMLLHNCDGLSHLCLSYAAAHLGFCPTMLAKRAVQHMQVMHAVIGRTRGRS